MHGGISSECAAGSWVWVVIGDVVVGCGGVRTLASSGGL